MADETAPDEFIISDLLDGDENEYFSGEEDLENLAEISISSRTSVESNGMEVAQNIESFEYEMNNENRGVAIIFNHTKFDLNTEMDERNGTDKDVEALLEHLPLLGFERENIIVKSDLTTSEVLSFSYKLQADKEAILNNCDCIAIFILSHGDKNNLIYARNDSYDLFTFVEQFTPNLMPPLAGKPKLFFIQACRGGKLDDGVLQKFRMVDPNTTGDSVDGNRSSVSVTRPSHADIFISHSAYHDHSAFRNDEGSWYIQDFCKTIEKYDSEGTLKTTDLTELLTYTNFLTSQRSSTGLNMGKKQCPIFSSGLSRKLCFK